MRTLLRFLAGFVLITGVSASVSAQDDAARTSADAAPPEPAPARSSPEQSTAPASAAALPPPAAPSTDVHAEVLTPGYGQAPAAPAPAAAASEAATRGQPALPAARPAAPEAHGRDARQRDAHVDRVLLMPTAETQPAGTTTLSSYEIVLLQAGYALSDSTQLTLSATPPIEGALPLDLTLKSTVARGDAYRLAFFGGVSGISGLPNGPFWIGRAGFVGQGCLDVNCRSSVNLGAMALLAGPATFVGTGLGAVLRVSELFALLFEVDTLVPSGRAVAEIHGVSLGSGFRWSGRRWAVDAALFASLEGNVATVPYVVASYRFLDD